MRGPEHHAGLLARRRAHARRLRRRGLLQDGRRARLRRSGDPARRASCSRDGSPRTSSSRPARGSGSGRCARRCSRRSASWSQDVVIAGARARRRARARLPEPRGLPRARRRRRATRRPATCSAHAGVRSRFAGALSPFSAAQAGSSTRVARALLLDEPPSLDAQRDHRQGLDQPEGGAAAPRRAGRRALRRRPPARAHRRHRKDDDA